MKNKVHESIELLKKYRKYLRKLFGKQLEESSWVEYDSGWYRIQWATRCSDGSIGIIGWDYNSYRKKDFIKEISRLKERIKELKEGE